METLDSLTEKLFDLLDRQRDAMKLARNGAAMRRGRSVSTGLAVVDQLSVEIDKVRAKIAVAKAAEAARIAAARAAR